MPARNFYSYCYSCITQRLVKNVNLMFRIALKGMKNEFLIIIIIIIILIIATPALNNASYFFVGISLRYHNMYVVSIYKVCFQLILYPQKEA